MNKYIIKPKKFDYPIIEANDSEDAMNEFATIGFDSNLNTYFEAVKYKSSSPLMCITNIVWDLDDIEDEAEAFSIMSNLPKSEDLSEFITEEQVANYLSDKYGYCIKSYQLKDNSWGCAEAFKGISNYHNNNVETNESTNKSDFRTITPDDVINVLAAAMPEDYSGFNSETGFGEPQHWMDMPNGRSLEIVWEDTGDDKRYYSWRLHCSENEFDNDDFHGTMGVIWESSSDDFNYDTRLSMIEEVIKVSKYEAIKAPIQFETGDKVRFSSVSEDNVFCYVVDVAIKDCDNNIKIYNTNTREIIWVNSNTLTKEGHSEMAKKIFD